ncbi:salicylate hydroxylase [Mycena rebaudengoi]|nr:salicylate hydroxylase [Mycena rebaudengoi]
MTHFRAIPRFTMKPRTVVIVGAGIGGLQTALALAANGHKVTVLESAKEFLEVAAGIRVPPSSSRLSLAWGEMSRGNRFVDWHGTRLLDCPFDDVHTRYDAPYYFIHRSDIIDALVAAVDRQNNITLRMDTPVMDYDFEAPTVTTTTTTSSGEQLPADLVICADGIKSAVRSAVNGRPVDPVDTGDVAYRILVPAVPLLADPKMRYVVPRHGRAALDGPPRATRWATPCAAGNSTTHSMERFADWCPEVQKLCALTGKYLKWKLADFAELQRWVHPAGRVALLGGACHPMMPYLAQGAAQATEDAAAPAAALRAHEHDISAALRTYEAQRKPRAAYIARNTRVLQEWLHLHDGLGKTHRDELMRHDSPDNPIFWACSERRDYGHDVTKLSNEAIPAFQPMPNPVVSVYKGREEL